jgi:hypothetical protein
MEKAAARACFIPLLMTLILIVCPPVAYPRGQQTTQEEQSAQQREPWNLGVRPANWTGTSTLTIANRCKRGHLFDILPESLSFLQFLAQTHNVSISGHQTKDLPVQFDTHGMDPGEYNGQVVVRCKDCLKEPGCTQDREFVPVHIVIGSEAVTPPRENPAPTEVPRTNPPVSEAPEPPRPITTVPPPTQTRDQSRQDCEQGAEEPVPDLLSLLRFKGYTARITDLPVEPSHRAQTSITTQPQFQALLRELHKKGYAFPEGFAGAHVVNIDLKQGNCSTRLTVARFRSNIKPDGTMAGITVALDGSAPDRSLFMAHVTNVYALQPEEMPPNNPTISFNHEPWFTVQIGEAPPSRFVSPFWPIIWYRYWWYDSHRHANWWYGCYQWWWWRYRWYGRPWFWWYNWWWGYYYWWNWDFWSTWWAPYGPYLGLPPE